MAAARKLLDELAFTVEVNDAVLDVAKLKADMANNKADAAQKAAGTATEQAMAALKAAGMPALLRLPTRLPSLRPTRRIRNLALTIAALEGDVNAVAALLESTTAAVESKIAALSGEFAAEARDPRVRVADLENIVADHGARLDLLSGKSAAGRSHCC